MDSSPLPWKKQIPPYTTPPPKKKKWDKKKKQWHLSFTPPKTNMTMEKTTMNEDVIISYQEWWFPIAHVNFQGSMGKLAPTTATPPLSEKLSASYSHMSGIIILPETYGKSTWK